MMSGFCVVLFSAYCVLFMQLTNGEEKMASACHGTISETCNYITLECGERSRIRVLSMKYGLKDYTCENKKKNCLNSDENGCCVHREGDCVESYNSLHSYNLHRACSGKQRCGPMPVPTKILSNCNDTTVHSTYVQVMYECQSDDTIVSICNDERIGVKDIGLTFNSVSDSLSTPRSCSCFVSSTTSISIDYVDVRMTKEFNTNPGSDCSSATLTTTPANDIDATCDASVAEENNFVYGDLAVLREDSVEIKVLDLYKNGNKDAPTFIWLNVFAEGLGMLNSSCFEHTDTHTDTTTDTHTDIHTDTHTDTTTDTHTDTNTTSGSSNNTRIGDDGSNTGAIVAGVLVAIFLLVVIVAVVAVLVWKRRGYLWKKRTPAKANSYTNNGDIENSVENNAYAVIGYVPDIPDTNRRKCDTVHASTNKEMPLHSNSSSCDGHTYHNINNVDKDMNKQSKKPSWPLGILRSQRDRLISHFRHQTENDIPQVKKGPEREVANGSYDHLRQESAKSSVQVQVTAPVDGPSHVYSHTTDRTVRKQAALYQERTKNTVPNQSSSIENQSEVEINAVNVGDLYIEFQCVAMGANNPNSIKAPEVVDTNENVRPQPPSRPPPSPSRVAKLKKSPSPNPKLNLSVQNEQQSDIRQISSNHLSQDHLTPGSEVDYDYATEIQVPSRSISPRGSDVANSDSTSEHSYKIPEEQQVYDYAEVSDADVAEEDQYGSVYEDVDNDPRLASVRKHKSAIEIPQDQNEYMAPVSTRTRAISLQGVNTELSSKINAKTEAVSESSLLKSELNEKAQQRRQTKHNPETVKNGDVKSDKHLAKQDKMKTDNGCKAIQSDNTDTKDYQKVDKMKGVLQMATLFENKDNASDTSMKSSPRHIRGTSPHNPKTEVNQTSSDV